jgi:hypothetical protein
VVKGLRLGLCHFLFGHILSEKNEGVVCVLVAAIRISNDNDVYRLLVLNVYVKFI